MGSSLAKEILDKMPAAGLQFVPVTVTGDSPLMVSVAGSETSVPARSGDLLAVGASAFALWQPPLPPVVFATSVDDTGWVNVSYASGWSAGTPGQLQYRRIGNQVHLRGGGDHGTDFTQGATVATLPTGARPGTRVRIMCFGALRRAVAVDITTAGDISVGWPDPVGAGTGDPSSWVGINTRYLTD